MEKDNKTDYNFSLQQEANLLYDFILVFFEKI